MANATLLALTAMLSLLLMISPCLCSTNALYSALGGGTLDTDERLVYGEYTLIMQGDCNLVLYKSGGIPIWHTNTYLKNTRCHLTLHSNGELVVYGYIGGQNRRLWGSGVTSTEGSYALVLKFDGSLHVYGPILWSNPSQIGSESDSLINNTSSVTRTFDSTLWSGDVAPIGPTIECNEYKLELLQSCNLTLSNTNTGAILWYTNKTHFLGDCYVNLEPNGELKIKYLGGDTMWTNGVRSESYSEFVLALRPDGRLIVYGPSIWAGGKLTGDVAVVAAEIAMVSEV